MERFEELLNKASKDELDNKIPSNFNFGASFEESVFKKIRKRKKQIRLNIVASIIFTLFGAFFGYLIINDVNLDKNHIKSVPVMAKNNKLNNNKKKKEEVWATDDIYFSTYDEKANYAIEQVSLTNYEEEI